jgi:Dna[CI] antecedent, DciA
MSMDRAAAAGLASRLFGRNPVHTLALLRAAWPLAVGPELARRTEVLTLDGRVLRIRVPDAGWRKVLHRMRRDIVVRLREVAGELAPTRFGFIEGGIVPLPAPPPAPAATAGGPLSEAIAEGAATIADAEIRQLFLVTARRYLGRVSAPSSPQGSSTPSS